MARQPNVLFILADQHRYDCIGYSNAYPVKTPHLDRLASEGMGFTNAYTPIPLCCPARQTLLNGRRAESFGAFWNYDIIPVRSLEPSEYSWPRELNQHGYKTGYVGKWHVHPDHSPTAYGFEQYVSESDYAHYRQAKYPEVHYTNGNYGEQDPIPLADTRTHWLASETIDMIEAFAQEDKPWHIRLDFPEPHLPCCPSAPFADLFDPANIPTWHNFWDDFTDKPYIQKQQLINWNIEHYSWDDWAPIVARYYGVISQMDDAIGKVLQKLDELGIAEETIVIYSADHGDMCGSHRMMDKHYIMYEDVVKVPLIIRWPKQIEAGSRCGHFVSHLLDLPPTILEMAGLQAKDFFHGRSLVPLWSGEPPQDWRTEVISTYNGLQFGLYTQRMIRNDQWKYVWNATDVDELYNLNDDPAEIVNLIHQSVCSDVVEQLREKLYMELKKCGDPMVCGNWIEGQLLSGNKL